jgi:aspartyl-tRNA(Asn)/glutamyl-tRNA(Gln) amidotransferase subunit C
MPRFSAADVRHVADLARIELTAAEIDLFAGQLAAVLDYAAQLQAVDTTGVPPTATVLPLRSVMREDEVRPSLPVTQALANAPDQRDGYFRVHAVLEGSQ